MLRDTVTGSMLYRCQASGLKWSTLQSVLPLVCDWVPQSLDHTNVYAEVWSQSMDTMDCPVATAQDGIHVTIK